MHGRSELVGYPVWLIPVTSVIPTRIGEYDEKALKRIQVFDALRCSGQRLCYIDGYNFVSTYGSVLFKFLYRGFRS